MTDVLISIGANTSDALNRVSDTISWLLLGADGCLTVTESTPPYSTSEISGRYPDYINALVIARTTVSPETLIALFKQLEQRAGRTPESKKNGLVPLDIDLISYGETILKPEDMNRPYTTIGLTMLTTATTIQNTLKAVK